jgi:hypothetical protein
MIMSMGMGRDFGRIGMIRAQERMCIEEVLCEYFFLELAMLMLKELNRYRQQAISSLTKLPSDMFQGNGDNFRTLGNFPFSPLSHNLNESKQDSNTGQIQITAKTDL